MTEHKFTDEEVMRALECLTGEPKLCRGCPYDGTEHYPFCREHCAKDALDLINRQRAEIERLKKDNEYILMQHKFQRRPSGDCWNDVIEKAKTEAIKEFAERLASKVNCIPQHHFTLAQVLYDIDTLVKEMTEGE